MKNVNIRIYLGNITQAQVAEEMGVSPMTISRWFNQKEMNPVQQHRVIEAADRIKGREEAEKEKALQELQGIC